MLAAHQYNLVRTKARTCQLARLDTDGTGLVTSAERHWWLILISKSPTERIQAAQDASCTSSWSRCPRYIRTISRSGIPRWFSTSLTLTYVLLALSEVGRKVPGLHNNEQTYQATSQLANNNGAVVSGWTQRVCDELRVMSSTADGRAHLAVDGSSGQVLIAIDELIPRLSRSIAVFADNAGCRRGKWFVSNFCSGVEDWISGAQIVSVLLARCGSRGRNKQGYTHAEINYSWVCPQNPTDTCIVGENYCTYYSDHLSQAKFRWVVHSLKRWLLWSVPRQQILFSREFVTVINRNAIHSHPCNSYGIKKGAQLYQQPNQYCFTDNGSVCKHLELEGAPLRSFDESNIDWHTVLTTNIGCDTFPSRNLTD